MKDQPINADTPRGQIARRLQDAIDELHADVARVELWASALTTFTQPIPDYGASKKSELKRAHALMVEKPADKA